MTKLEITQLAAALKSAKPNPFGQPSKQFTALEAHANCCYEVAGAIANATRASFDRQQFLTECGVEGKS